VDNELSKMVSFPLFYLDLLTDLHGYNFDGNNEHYMIRM
jgi:hypothetical protein